MADSLTIYDIARAAGSSPRTVSRYFNQPELLAAATHARIARIVASTGFRPSEVASRLSRRSRGAVAVMMGIRQGPPSELHQHLLGLIAVGVARRGRDLLLIGVTDDNAAAVAAQHLEQRKIEAALLLNHLPERLEAALATAAIPTVSLNWRPTRALAGNRYVGIDYYDSMRCFAVRLLSAGHRRLAWIGPAATGDRRTRAMFDVAEAVGTQVGRHAPATAADGWDGLLAAALAEGATLAACWCDADALALLAAARRAAVDVPGRLAVAGFDGLAAGLLVHPTLTTVMQPWQAMTDRAVDLLTAEAMPSGDTILPSEIRWGGSCPTPPTP